MDKRRNGSVKAADNKYGEWFIDGTSSLRKLQMDSQEVKLTAKFLVGVVAFDLI